MTRAEEVCGSCDCADPTTMPELRAECSCGCHGRRKTRATKTPVTPQVPALDGMTPLGLPYIPKSWPVQPLKPGQSAKDRMECGTCGRAWDDAKVTGMTSSPAARCPFESFH